MDKKKKHDQGNSPSEIINIPSPIEEFINDLDKSERKKGDKPTDLRRD